MRRDGRWKGDTPGVQGSFWAGRIATSGSRAWLSPPPCLPPQHETAGQTHLPGGLCSTHKTSPTIAPHLPLPPLPAPHPCCLGLHVHGNPGLGLCPGARGLGNHTVLPLGAGSDARKLRSRQDEKEWLSGSRRIRLNSLVGQVGGNGEQGMK